MKLTNAGQSPLVVTALQVYNPGLSVSIGKRTLKPGQSDKLKISTSPTNQGFKGRRRVLLITNDPVNPKIIIDIIIKNRQINFATWNLLLNFASQNRKVAQLVAHYVRDVGVGRSSRLIPTL